MNSTTSRVSCWRCHQVLWTEQDSGDPAGAAFHVCPVVRSPSYTLEDEVNAVEALVRRSWPSIRWWRKIRFSVELPVLRRIARLYDAYRRWRAR